MQLRQLQTFLAVAEHVSFTRAAEHLNYAQSTVTAQIQALEAKLGEPLFERLGKRIVLTNAGERLLPYARQIVHLIEEGMFFARSDDTPKGSLRVGAPESLCTYRLPELLQRFRRQYPDVQVILRAANCPELRHQLRTGELDVAFFLDSVRPAADLHIERVIEEQMVIIAAPGHPLSAGPVTVHDLEGRSLLVTEAGCSYREELETLLRTSRAQPAQTLEFNSVAVIKQCVMADIGIAQLPLVAVRAELEAGTLTALDWDGPDSAMVTQVAYHKDKWISPTLSAFLATVRATFH